MLYSNDFNIFRLIISFIALVIPQDGHCILKMVLNKQGICFFKQIKNININSK